MNTKETNIYNSLTIHKIEDYCKPFLKYFAVRTSLSCICQQLSILILKYAFYIQPFIMQCLH